MEGRPGTENFSSYYTQPSVGSLGAIYPSLWNLGALQKVHYIGKIFNNGSEIDGYLTIHAAPSGGTGNSSSYRVFINGVPVMYNACPTATSGTGVNPSSISVVRTTSKTGIPIIVLDGSYFIVNRECDIAVPYNTISYQFGVQTDNIPIFMAYKLGITAPTGACVSAASSGAGAITGTSYYWAYAYYNTKTGFESPLSPATTPIDLTAKNGELSSITRSTDPQVNAIRVYRKGGTLTSSWRLVTTITSNCAACPPGGAVVSYTDSTTDQTLAVAEKADTDTITPFSTVSSNGAALTEQDFVYNWGPFLGKYLFWVGDPVRKGYVYWNKAGDIARYNSLTSVTSVSDPGEVLQNGFIFSSTPFVFSKLNLYALDYGGTDALPEFTSRLIPIGMGLAGKWAFAVGPNAVYFLSRDGIYATDCQPGKPTSLTEESIKPIFQGKVVNGIRAINWSSIENARMAVTPKELHFFYPGDSYTEGGVGYLAENVHLVYDLERGAWSRWSTGSFVTTPYVNGYFDEANASSRLILGLDSSKTTYSIDDSRPTNGSETFDILARTGSLNNDIPLTYKEYGVLQVDGDLAATTLTVTPYWNSEVTTGSPISITPDNGGAPDYVRVGRRDYPVSLGDYYARSMALQFAWTESPSSHPILYQGNILFRDEEERVTHWEMPPTDFGNGGWFHLKDGYFCLRSDSAVTLTIVIDGTVTDTYTLATTGGEKLKIYQEFKARRGKVYQIKLDAVAPSPGTNNAAPFRFYGEESYLNGKPWITGATYQPLQPFGAPGYAQYRRKEGGT